MSDQAEKEKYVALLRGINVGGHKKVPMAELRELMGNGGYAGVKTLLNSGNVVFEHPSSSAGALEDQLAAELEKHFGFPVPVLVREAGDIFRLIRSEPFAGITVTKDTRLYVAFLKEQSPVDLVFPWVSEDGSYRILSYEDKAVCSVLDLSLTGTIDAMAALERFFGKNLTTRNWNTVVKIGGLLS